MIADYQPHDLTRCISCLEKDVIFVQKPFIFPFMVGRPIVRKFSGCSKHFFNLKNTFVNIMQNKNLNAICALFLSF